MPVNPERLEPPPDFSRDAESTIIRAGLIGRFCNKG